MAASVRLQLVIHCYMHRCMGNGNGNQIILESEYAIGNGDLGGTHEQ